MAVTRIKNNQITDASAGNAQLGVNAAVKLQNYTVTSTKIANNLVYGSDLTVTGNLTVQGNTTTIDTTITTIEDPVIVLASTQTSGAPVVDIGFLGYRGNQSNIAFVWDESADEFVTAFTSTGETNTTITITSYSNFHTNDANVGGNLVVGGNISITGNVASLNVTGNITGGNLLTSGLVSATANVTGGNLITGGAVTASGNVTGGNVLTGGLISATSTITSAANITGGNVLTGGLISATATITGGNLATGGTVSATGNVTGGNVLTGGLISATSTITSAANITGGNLLTGGLISATSTITSAANITGGNILTGGLISATSNITGGNVLTGGLISATSTITSAANIIGGNLLTGGAVSAAANVTGGNVLTGGLISATSTITSAANIIGGNVLTGGAVSATANITGGNLVTGGAITATGTITGGNLATGGTASVTGNVTGGNILTGGLISATANVTGGNVLTSGLVSATANVTGGNLLTGGQVSATGDIITAGNVSLSGNIVDSGALTITTGSGDITLNASGNINAGTNYINNVVNPVQDQDAATKIYVDNLVSTSISYHEAVVAATTTDLATTTGGTVTYNQPNGAGNGIGATLTTTGSFNLIDTANVQTANTRILVKDEANAAHNGVYVWSNSTVITRSSDTNTYGAGNVDALGLNDYFYTTSGNVNKGTAFIVDAPVGTITFGTSNIQFAVFSQSQVYSANTSAGLILNGTVFSAKVDNNTTAFDGGGNIIVKAGANLTTPNIGAATGTSLSVTGAVESASVTASGNVTGGNVLTGGLISATSTITSAANITGGNVLTGGVVSATANVTGGNLITGGAVTASGNVTGGNVLTGGLISATSTITSAANITGGNVLTGGVVSATANVTGGNLLTAGLISATSTITSAANITGGNVLTGGVVSATGNVTGGNLLFGSGIVSGTGNIYANKIFANISGNIDAAGSNTQVQFADTGDLLGASANFTFDKSTNTMTVSNGNIIGGNLLTGGLISATSTITSAANITGGNLLTGGLISATSTITSAANITGGNVLTGGEVSATGNVTGGNVTTAGLITATGNITGANLILTSGTINGPAAGRITVNGSDIDTDFAVDGDTVANVFYVDAGTGTASFGSSTQTTNAIVAFNATNSILMPVGNTGQRPSTGVTGMLRFNTTDNNLEIYNNSAWEAVGVPAFTVIADEQFNGDGSTLAFTLATSQTTNSCIVSINGVVQIPTVAYSVSTTTLTFTEAPAAGDLIDVRQITTTTTVTSISNTSGNAVIGVSDTAATITAEGNLIPVADNTYTLGNATNRWSNLFVSGNTIFLGNLQLKEASANTFAVFTSDGITQANIDAGAIDVSAITSGTSTIGIYGTGQGYITVNGNANVLLVSNTSALVNGAFSATGNITGGNLLTGGLISATSTITSAANITGGNVLTGGLISATGAITGAAITGSSLTVSTGNITGGNLLLSGAIIDSAQLDIQTSASNSNIALAPNGIGIVTVSTQVSAVGNVTGGNIRTAGLISATGAITGADITGTSLTVSTGNVSCGNIVNTNGNGIGNIGSSSTYFNTVFAKATSAQYADLAEKYTADADYEPGTVVMFGGAEEVTVCSADACRRVAGVISTNPSYIMNGTLEATHVATVALTGRVPCKVTGTVRKGDLMVSAGNGSARAEADPKVGTVIGKALADFDGTTGVIEVVVGRF